MRSLENTLTPSPARVFDDEGDPARLLVRKIDGLGNRGEALLNPKGRKREVKQHATQNQKRQMSAKRVSNKATTSGNRKQNGRERNKAFKEQQSQKLHIEQQQNG